MNNGRNFLVTDTTNQPFVRNAWYVAAWPEEIDEAPLARTIMNEPIVMFRDADGNVGAIEDRCCHRGAPLSHGTVVEKGLQCVYHGLVFDGDGKCVKIPGQKTLPDQANIQGYPLFEQHKIVWIWMGDPALADESMIVGYPWHDQTDKWPHRKECYSIKCNYMLMIDNLMDLTHLGYLHTKTIGGDPMIHVDADTTVDRTKTGVLLPRWMLDSNPPPTYQKGLGFKGKVARWAEFEYFAPSTIVQWSGGLDVGKGARENREQDGFHLRLLHAVTPETETTCFYFWSTANGHRQDEPQATEDMYNEIVATFIEDIDILEAQQSRIDLNPDRPLVSIYSDGAMTYARRALREMIDGDDAGVGSIA